MEKIFIFNHKKCNYTKMQLYKNIQQKKLNLIIDGNFSTLDLII